MIGPLIDFDDLRKLSRLGDAAKLSTVERWAQRVGIKYAYDSRGGIWTTMDAMNAAIGVVQDPVLNLYDVDKVA